jgi:cephalosporin hydroxylase
MKFYLPKILEGGGATIIEFGTYKGGSAIFMAALAKHLKLPLMIYGLDTFEGMPETNPQFDAHSKGNFSDTDLNELNHRKDELQLNNLFFVKGLFEDTAMPILKSVKNVAIAHIDCDIYEAVKYVYKVVKPFMIKGGYCIFDDATEPSCIGATSAVEELVIREEGLNSEQIYPHFVFRT